METTEHQAQPKALLQLRDRKSRAIRLTRQVVRCGQSCNCGIQTIRSVGLVQAKNKDFMFRLGNRRSLSLTFKLILYLA